MTWEEPEEMDRNFYRDFWEEEDADVDSDLAYEMWKDEQ